MQSFLDGKRTWIGLIVTIIGATGLSKYIAPDQTTALLDALFQVVGIAIAVIGNARAQKKIIELKTIRDELIDNKG